TSSRVKQILTSIFTLDLRSLAVLRIGTGILLLSDFILYSRDLGAFFTDNGVLPHQFALNRLLPWSYSIHALNGSFAFEIVLFLISVFFAGMLIVGYKTRVATIVSWILLISVQNRIPIIGAGDDLLLRMILFWGIFLPWNAVYSVDSFRKKIVVPE